MTPERASNPSLGKLYVFTGNGKGKTSAALGIMLRGLSRGWHVTWIALYKESTWDISEFQFAQHLSPEAQQRLEVMPMGVGFFIPEEAAERLPSNTSVKTARVGKTARVVDSRQPDEHLLAAHKALASVQATLASPAPPHLVVIDELCNALSDGLLSWTEVEPILTARGATHVIVTGRAAPPELVELASLVSEIANIKHPYDHGELAVAGLDF